MTGEVHIYRATGQRYQARVRDPGCRRFARLGRPSTSARVAIMALARAMATARPGERGEVIYWADYYEPLVLVEMIMI